LHAFRDALQRGENVFPERQIQIGVRVYDVVPLVLHSLGLLWRRVGYREPVILTLVLTSPFIFATSSAFAGLRGGALPDEFLGRELYGAGGEHAFLEDPGAGHEGEFVFEEGSVVDRLPDVDWMREETAVIWDLRDAGVWGVETAFAVCGAGGGESEVCA
jgi:hypothetical protein